jgi:hypothetical protein
MHFHKDEALHFNILWALKNTAPPDRMDATIFPNLLLEQGSQDWTGLLVD